jgi:hypothetical protein
MFGPSDFKIRNKIFQFLPLHVYAIIKIRFLLSIRNKLAFVFRFLSPIPFLILTILLPKLLKTSINYDANNLPSMNLQIDDYATMLHKFVILNNTPYDVDTQGPRLDENLVVNPGAKDQKCLLEYLNTTDDLLHSKQDSYGGIIFNEWNNDEDNSLTLLYNDSALLSAPYLINTLTNLYTRQYDRKLINASISAWPKTVQTTIEALDFSSFTFLILLGAGMLIPLVSFATEIVHDREVNFAISYVGFIRL